LGRTAVHLLPGASLHRELQLLVRAGLTPLEALQTATLNPAKFFGKADWGEIAPGKAADLVVLTRNPLSDIANTRAVAAVIADGGTTRRASSTACAFASSNSPGNSVDPAFSAASVVMH
jgi:imidazolonepropionase-like amidohydrolase